MKYDKKSTEALIPAVGVNETGLGEVFRLNLEVGRYMRAFEVDVGGDDLTTAGGGALQGGIGTGSVNTAAVAEESHNLLAFGTSLGTVEFWDPRTRARVTVLQQPMRTNAIEGRQEITCLQFKRSGLQLATGSSAGLIHLYDLRSPVPFLRKDQGYGYPIQDLIYLEPSSRYEGQSTEPKLLSADKRIIKIWNERDGTPWTSVEPAVDLHSVAWCKDSGMLLTANEGRQQHAFFIPQLGTAPKWCSFLDNLVEELAEDPNDPNAFTRQRAGEVYDNYKFLTLQQLESLNLSHLVGTTTLLRPYMHGYFVAQRLYEEAKLIADPFIWEEQRVKRVREKIEGERESRIRGNKKLSMKVNKRLAEKIIEREEKNERRKAKRILKMGNDHDIVDNGNESANEQTVERETNAKGLLVDPRFAKLFEDEEFAIDESSREFKSLNPSTVPQSISASRTERHLTAVEEEELGELPGSSEEDSTISEKYERPKTKDSGRISSSSYKRSGHKSQQPEMVVTSSKRPMAPRDRSFGSRAVKPNKEKSKFERVVGVREVTFAPRKMTKHQNPDQGPKAPKRDRDSRRSASGNVMRNL